MLDIPQVRFSDEKRFKLKASDKPAGVWRKADQRLHPRFVGKKSLDVRSVMVWLCIAGDGSSLLLRCPDRMDSEAYQTEILTPALPFIKGRNLVFQQDWAACHGSRSTRKWFADHSVPVLWDYPSFSPDLNPVENCWPLIVRNLKGHKAKDLDSLWEAIEAAWAKVPRSVVCKMFSGMVRRLTAVQVARGGHTKY